MKKCIFILSCCLLLSLTLPAREKPALKGGSRDSAGYHKLNFSFTWFEAGGIIALREKKLRSLPYGMNNYLYKVKGGMAVGFLGIGLFYKNHWGISAIFSMQDYSVPDGDFKNYISSQYPNYFLTNNGELGHIYSLNSINYRLSYRFHKGHFTFEPQLQLGINDCDDFDTHFVLKEKNSNHFVEYDIRKENKRKYQLSYRAGVITRWRFTRPDWKWNIEPGIKLELLLAPTNYNYTITAAPYNMPPAVYELNVKQMRPALLITVAASVFRK